MFPGLARGQVGQHELHAAHDVVGVHRPQQGVVAGAGHNTLLGPMYADHIVRGVEFVLANLPAR